MVPPESFSPPPSSSMAKSSQKNSHSRNSLLSSCLFSDCSVFFGGAMAALLFVWALWTVCNNLNPSIVTPSSSSSTLSASNSEKISNTAFESLEKTFYDDPFLDYTLGTPMKDWDEKRAHWARTHPWIPQREIIMVTGSQPTPCKNPIGDHLLLRLFKNKVDYCRLHGYDVFYNNVLLHPKMHSFWAKLPVVKAAMIAHPEAEWVWWVDSDAAITDMDFTLPLDKYAGRNLIVHGWEDMVFEKKSWVGLNAGIFLMRNCQWSMEFMDVWAEMGPQSPNYAEWGRRQKQECPDKMFKESDDQTGLVYLLLKQNQKWGDKIFLENSFYFEGYWIEIVPRLDNISRRYEELERANEGLRRRHAEKTSEWYGKKTAEQFGDEPVTGKESLRRPFITHFTGCQPCSGNHNEMYSGENCYNGMVKVLNFADNQVLRNMGFYRKDLLHSESVFPSPFDFPSGQS